MNSPGLGPGRVRSSAGLVNFLVLVLVIGIGEGLPSPLTPLPWASGREMCLPDRPPKVAVSPWIIQLKPSKMQHLSHFWPPRGGSVIQPLLSFQPLHPKIPQDPQDPPKTSIPGKEMESLAITGWTS